MRALALLLLCLGCATGSKFTRPEELDEIARAPLPKAPEHRIASVAEWQLEGPLPERVEHVALQDASKPFARVVLEAAKGRFLVTTDLGCVAEQRARFGLQHEGASPGLLLGTFIEARCGTPSDSVRSWDLYGEVPEETGDEELARQWGGEVVKALADVPDRAFAGIALARQGKQARVVLTWAVDDATFEPVSIFPDGDVVRVRGTMLKQVEHLWGRINQGPDASADCVLNPQVKLPRFELACPVTPGSDHDWLGIWAREPGRFLGYPVFTTLVWSSRSPSPKWVRPTVGLARDASPEAFLEALNAQRTRLGRPLVVMSPAQTEQARSLVPPYVAASRTSDASRVDRIALGLMAGWRVEGAVTEGWFTSSSLPAEAGAELLAALLELPGGRNELLAKEVRVLALGQVEHAGLTESLICTYALLDEPAPTVARQQSVIDKLNAERARRGLPAAQWVQLPTKTAETVAAQVRSRELDPGEGVDELMTDAMHVIRKSVKGWQIYSSSLDEVKWPDELLERPTLQVLMTIAPWKAKDMPWTQYVLMVVLFEGATTQA